MTVPGHMQRGGTPVPYDRVLSTRIGAHAADMIKNNEFGKLVVVKNNVITDIPLAESAGKLKYVDPQSDISKRGEAYRNQFRRLIENVISSVIQEMAPAGIRGCKRPGPYR